MEDGPVPKRPRRAICIVCDACGKQFAASYAFDQHRRSGYLRGTACHVLDDGSIIHARPIGGHITADHVNCHAAETEAHSKKPR
jgi:hypothetical protein